MNKETLKHRIEYALEHIYKYDDTNIYIRKSIQNSTCKDFPQPMIRIF